MIRILSQFRHKFKEIYQFIPQTFQKEKQIHNFQKKNYSTNYVKLLIHNKHKGEAIYYSSES